MNPCRSACGSRMRLAMILLDSAGNPTLMSEPLKTTLCDQRRR
jgi:hypothetical protein